MLDSWWNPTTLARGVSNTWTNILDKDGRAKPKIVLKQSAISITIKDVLKLVGVPDVLDQPQSEIGQNLLKGARIQSGRESKVDPRAE